MSVLVLVYADFIAQFPEFETVSQSVVQMNFDMASNYISTTNYGSLRDNARLLALYQLTAHLLSISSKISTNASTGTTVAATEGSVSVTLLQPTATNEFSFWLNSTPYGQQLLALLRVKAAFGIYSGGSYAAQGNIRKPSGRFR